MVASKDGAELLTDGLSGCVAVMAWTNEQAFLAHVYSKCTPSNNNLISYLHELDLPILIMTADDTIQGGAIAYSDDQLTWLTGQMRDWLKRNASKLLKYIRIRVSAYCLKVPMAGQFIKS